MKETSVFLQTFGNTPVLRVMDFLAVNDDFDYSMTDIADLSGVGYATLKLFWNKLEKQQIVVKTREVGKAKLYKLNTENTAVKKFREFYWECTKQKVHSELKQEAVANNEQLLKDIARLKGASKHKTTGKMLHEAREKIAGVLEEEFK